MTIQLPKQVLQPYIGVQRYVKTMNEKQDVSIKIHAVHQYCKNQDAWVITRGTDFMTGGWSEWRDSLGDGWHIDKQNAVVLHMHCEALSSDSSVLRWQVYIAALRHAALP